MPNNIKKHVSYLTADEVTEICQPLFKTFNLNYFSYGRAYPDGSIAFLNSDRHWNHCFHENKYHEKTSITYNNGIHLGANYTPAEIITNLANNFNHHSWVNIARQYTGYVEFSGLAAPSTNLTAVEFFFNHVDLLENFLLFFKDKANSLIKKAVEERFFLATPPVLYASSHHEKHNNFLDQTKPNHFHLNHHGQDIILSRKEYEVAYLTSTGKTAKEVATALNVSYRTVEHRLENIKAKLNSKSRSEIFELLKTNSIIR